MTELDELDLFAPPASAPVVGYAPRHGVSIRVPDPVRQRTNRLNRSRGKSTSAELAKYLGWQNVEAMGWKWDVQGSAGRLQSKRDATGRSARTVAELIRAITPGDYLRGLYRVEPRKRLASGIVTLLLEEWVAERGWILPASAVLATAADGTPLLTLGLPEFRELVTGTKENR